MLEREKQFIKKEFPIGTGRESEPKETLPAVEVKNEVTWVNPDFSEMPFDLQVGKSTKLGMFLTPKPKEGEPIFDLKVQELHGRSGLLGRVIFKDKQDRLYRDVDLKGIGSVEFDKSGKPQVGRPGWSNEGRYEGSLYSYRAQFDIATSENFLKLGIRTERYLAVIKLKEIIDENGEKISIKDATLKNMTDEPIIAIRALGTKHRITDINDTNLLDAKTLVAQEIGLEKEKFSWSDYLKWFSQTSGENVGIMHKNEYTHGHLFNHNVTLDCRIVDLGSVYYHWPEQDHKIKFMKVDYIKAGHGNLQKLFKKVSLKDSSIQDFNEYLNYFNEAYVKALGYTPKFITETEEERKEKKQKNKIIT